MKDRICAFCLGWKRRSRLLLDYAGCPMWLARLRCPVPDGWGRALQIVCVALSIDDPAVV